MKKVLLGCLLAAIVVAADEAWARAGGSRSKSGGLFGAVLLPVTIVYAWLLVGRARRKSAAARQLISRFTARDPAWDIEALERRVKTAYLAIQRGWMARDQERCRPYMTERLYREHEEQLESMRQRHRQNILESISIEELLIVQVADHANDDEDSFWVFIQAAMIDYEINTLTGSKTDGDRGRHRNIELWRFCRDPERGWVADEIDPSVGFSKLSRLKSYWHADPAA